MAIFNPVGSSTLTIASNGATNPSISNVILTANIEVGLALPAGTRQYLLKLRDAGAKLQLAFTSGDSATTYLTVPPGTFYADSDLTASGITIYVQTPSSGQTLELLTWT